MKEFAVMLLTGVLGMVIGASIAISDREPEKEATYRSELLTCDDFTLFKDYLTGEITLYIGDANP